MKRAPGSFTKEFEPARFSAMLGVAAALAYGGVKAAAIFVLPLFLKAI